MILCSSDSLAAEARQGMNLDVKNKRKLSATGVQLSRVGKSDPPGHGQMWGLAMQICFSIQKSSLSYYQVTS